MLIQVLHSIGGFVLLQIGLVIGPVDEATSPHSKLSPCLNVILANFFTLLFLQLFELLVRVDVGNSISRLRSALLQS